MINAQTYTEIRVEIRTTIADDKAHPTPMYRENKSIPRKVAIVGINANGNA